MASLSSPRYSANADLCEKETELVVDSASSLLIISGVARIAGYDALSYNCAYLIAAS